METSPRALVSHVFSRQPNYIPSLCSPSPPPPPTPHFIFYSPPTHLRRLATRLRTHCPRQGTLLVLSKCFYLPGDDAPLRSYAAVHSFFTRPISHYSELPWTGILVTLIRSLISLNTRMKSGMKFPQYLLLFLPLTLTPR